MNITDEQLSAFLDNELPQAEMDAVRDALAEDDALVDRLAELAEVDRLVAGAYHAIDEQPMPESVTNLLSPSGTDAQTDNQGPGQKAEVVEMSRWRQLKEGVNHVMQRHAGLAAAIALVIGMGFTGMFSETPNGSTYDSIATSPHNGWQGVARVLESYPTGQAESLPDGRDVTPVLSFQNYQGHYCRVYRVSAEQGALEGLACRENERWRQRASARVSGRSEDLYQPASGGSALDKMLDDEIAMGPFDAEQEAQLIRQGW